MSKTQRMTQRPVTLEKRADGQQTLTGYAAVFYRAGSPGTEYVMWTDLVERIRPGAFDRALQERQDVRGLFNHGADCLLGRLSSGTLRLSVDDVGLRYEIDLPDTQTAKDVAALVSRGDLSGSSFTFGANKTEWDDTGTVSVRTLIDVDLYDVGPVTFPAYVGTSTAIRSQDREVIDAERAELARVRRIESDRVEVALAMANLK